MTTLYARKLGRPARRELGDVLPPEDGSLERPYRTLRAAVAASLPGDTIALGTGLWRGSVTVAHPLQFASAAGWDAVTEANFTVQANVAFENLTLNGVPPTPRGRNARRRAYQHKLGQRAIAVCMAAAAAHVTASWKAEA